MGIRLVIAIIAIIQIIISFIPAFIYSFSAQNNFAVESAVITIVMAIFSFIFFIILLSLVSIDSLKNKGNFILGFLLVLFLSGFGAIIYLVLSGRYVISNAKKVSDPEVKFNGVVMNMLNSDSFSKVSEQDKKLILNMERTSSKDLSKDERFTKKEDDDNVVYYKNGKPVCRREFKKN